jgi:hypothetical protein
MLVSHHNTSRFVTQKAATWIFIAMKISSLAPWTKVFL